MTPEAVPAIPLTQDQILAQLMTRGFEQGFQRSPLRDFWGKLTSITGEMRTGQSGSFAVALYNFDEVEVIESVEPYTSPIGQVEVFGERVVLPAARIFYRRPPPGARSAVETHKPIAAIARDVFDGEVSVEEYRL